MDGLYTPEGLGELLKRDQQSADARLAAQPVVFGFCLRHYQQAAIQAMEAAIAGGRRELLLAMDTGTGARPRPALC